MIKRPISIYINWAAYDELSDAVELDETIAMRQMDELLRLRSIGINFDYYLMDAFWYARDGAYRTWRTPHWPQGPDRWIETCLANGIKPGLWLAGNALAKLEVAQAWQRSVNTDQSAMCLFYGGFFPDLLEAMRGWYQRGVRLFKFDFMNLNAGAPAVETGMLPLEIRAQNIAALRAGLKAFRQECPEVVLIGYNGFEETETQNRTDAPFRKTVDPAWLETFDSLYCGDPRPADVPAMAFWRSKDIYTDHMVRVYERNGFPLQRIDNAGFMIGTTGTCYYRGTAAWQGMLILSLARGGWVNTYYGNLDLLDDEKARWFARVQALFTPFKLFGHTSTFGAMPGQARPYGYLTELPDGALITLVNPSQSVQTIDLPPLEMGQLPMRLLFHDAGFQPGLTRSQISLGPEQMALVGAGAYANQVYDLGIQVDVVIPAEIEPIPVEFNPVDEDHGSRSIGATLTTPASGVLRIILRQHDPSGRVRRTTGGAPPAGISLGSLLSISVEQAGESIPVTINYDKAIWSGLSWAVGEAPIGEKLKPGLPVTIRCASTEPERVLLSGEVYRVIY